MAMDVEGSNPRDNNETMGSSATKVGENDTRPGRVNGLGKASDVPIYTSYKDYDVFSGGPGLGQKEYTESTFHTSGMTEGDAIFKLKANQLQDTAGSLLKESRRFQSAEDDGEESDLKEQSKEAAL